MECPQATIIESDKSTPSLAGFHYTGYVIAGRFIPTRVCIQADTLEDRHRRRGRSAQVGAVCRTPRATG